MAGLQDYKCPCCGGAIEFNSSVQKMKCPFCDSEFDLDTLASYDEEVKDDANSQMDWDSSGTQEWTDGESDGTKLFICESCGGQIMADANTAASSCPYCDNPIVVRGTVAGGLKPDCIIPFKLDKDAAKNKFKEHLKGKKFLPSVFKSENHIDDIKGVYVPYWLFDSKADAKMRYRAEKKRRWEDKNFEYTETSYYACIREGDISFEHVPVDGSTKMPDDLMESLEPYDYKEAKSFQMAYLAGYVADKYDQDAEASVPRANERIENSTERAFRETVKGYSNVTKEGGNIRLKDGKTSYAMYPVWLLNTTWRNEKFVFAMNGQTGKFVGNLPIDKNAAYKSLFIGSVVSIAIVFIIQMLMNAMGMLDNEMSVRVVSSIVIGFIIGLIKNMIDKSSLKSVAPNNEARNYMVPGSMHVTKSNDMFLYKRTESRKKPEPQKK